MELNKNKRIFQLFWSLRFIKILVILIIFLVSNSCTVSFKFNGAYIDYTKIKTISITDFINTAELVYAPLSQEFTEKLRDVYTKSTRLQMLKKGGDLHIEGEIVDYQLTPMAISADTYASQTKLTITVNVRFSNSKNPEDDFEKKYSAYQTFDSNNLLTDVQDGLLKTMIDEITDNIYNDTVAKW
ncbi:MAG: LPS assembly lipoprotein LptE [Bacteroidales bacterium]|nr:LPS assembly lipoprotein LptE [Bacteroidales bacterium]